MLEGLQREVDFSSQVFGRIEIDGDAFGCGEVACQRRFLAKRTIGFCVRLEISQACCEFGARIRAEYHGAAQRCFGRDARDRAWHRVMTRVPVSASSGQPARNVLLEHGVEVGAAEAECADTGATYAARRFHPVGEFGGDVERRVFEVDVRVFLLAIETRWQNLLVERQGRLQDAGRAGCALEMANVRFYGTKCDAVRFRARAREHVGQAFYLDDVPHARRRAVALDVTRRRWRQPGIFPGTLYSELLADRVRCRDALTLAVARTAHAAQHGVDVVAVALGVFETLQQEQCRSLAHDEAIGTIGIGARAGRRQSADLAEFDERRGAHVAIDASGDHGIVVVFLESLDRRTDRRHGGCARGIDDVVGAVKVEQVGNAARHDVGELARHRVFGDLWNSLPQAGAGFCDDLLAQVFG